MRKRFVAMSEEEKMVVNKIASMINTDNIKFTQHAVQRMRERRINYRQLKSMLRNNNYEVIEFSRENKGYNVLVRKINNNLNNNVSFVVNLDNSKVTVITCYRLDETKKRNVGSEEKGYTVENILNEEYACYNMLAKYKKITE